MGIKVYNALSDKKIQSLKPKAKAYKVTDGEGLYIQVAPNGSKLWYLSFRLNDKRDRMAYGQYPVIGLADARDKRLEDRKLIAQGIHPRQQRQELEQKQNAASQLTNPNSVHNVFKRWHEANMVRWNEKSADVVERRFIKYVFPDIAHLDVSKVKPKHIKNILTAMEAAKVHDVAERIKQYLTSLFRFAVYEEVIEVNPAGDLRGILVNKKKKHYPYLPPEALPDFFCRLQAYESRASRITILAMRLYMHTFLRNSELRLGRFSEIDWERRYWKIPGDRMKMKKPHYVPLSTQALVMLAELQSLAGKTPWIFPGTQNIEQPMSDGTTNKALRLMGYDTKTEVTTHGFRTTASSILNESGLWHPDAIERQLAHEEKNEVRGTYNNATHLRQRVKMMQWWGDYLEGIENGSIDPMDILLGEENVFEIAA
jgi:integrase